MTELNQAQLVKRDELMATIERVSQAERITKQGLSDLSRELLNYLIDSEDVRPINALLGYNEDNTFILTPINWRIAVQYFSHFVGFTSNYDEVKEYAIEGTGKRQPLVFNKKAKKRWDKCVALMNEWLEDPTNDIWVWSNNTKMDAAPKDWRVELQKVVSNAMGNGKAKQQGEMTLADVMSAMAELEDVTIHDLIAATEHMTVPETTHEAA